MITLQVMVYQMQSYLNERPHEFRRESIRRLATAGLFLVGVAAIGWVSLGWYRTTHANRFDVSMEGHLLVRIDRHTGKSWYLSHGRWNQISDPIRLSDIRANPFDDLVPSGGKLLPKGSGFRVLERDGVRLAGE